MKKYLKDIWSNFFLYAVIGIVTLLISGLLYGMVLAVMDKPIVLLLLLLPFIGKVISDIIDKY